ncbi:hypothetical protein [Geodermatophilus sabuli]|uniref:Uncharacterized protein n=1 Tax=Geodermatophilus sabuli TaxID=1564158 RepID=A0A285E9I8_9ACTN|nr:hypothetical protein [Geodermatophilus sabuli]MBB3082253.1 hypothetical protein [Geodermatophilus sabuli]SNX94874.1 hypothetical protein SAMN06893097_101675 [Geodermatophilus sabuli]
MTVRDAVPHSSPPAGTPPARVAAGSRREVVELLRRLAVYVETAAVLDERAGRCGSPHLAAVLRERAAARRRTAELVRADLAAQGVATVLRRPSPRAARASS